MAGEVGEAVEEGGGSASSGDVKPAPVPVFRDIHRYFCEFCGICRSKKSLIRAHVFAHHGDELAAQSHGMDEEDEDDDEGDRAKNTCLECGASFRKPAYLAQHMQSHSLRRPFTCPVEDCFVSYRRKDHLARHLLKHKGEIFACSVENCGRSFVSQANVDRHVKNFHGNVSIRGVKQQHISNEAGCGKVFKYPSQLRKHEEMHDKPETIEVICCEPGCLKPFSNSECLKAHVRSCHQYIACAICGDQLLKRNAKRHLRMHKEDDKSERINCSHKGCQHTFSTQSNLAKHLKAAHLGHRPFACRVAGCGKKFSYKHTRDNHEESGIHVYVQGSFVEADELRSHSRPDRGCKRKRPLADTLLRKRVVPPGGSSAFDDGHDYLGWLLSADDD